MMLGEVQPDLGEELPDPAADLEEAQPEGVELHAGHAAPDQPAAQGIEQPVGGGVQEQPELVGPEAVAAEAIGEAGVLEILDPQLRFAPIDIPVVERLRRIRPAGDHEAGVGALGQRLGFEDDPPRRAPRSPPGTRVSPTKRTFSLRSSACCSVASASRAAASACRRALGTKPMV